MDKVLGIDGRLANAPRRAGVGNFCFGLLQALPPHLQDIRLRIYLDAPAAADFPIPPEEAEFCILPRKPLWTQRVLGPELRRRPPSVFLSPVLQLPFRAGCRTLATIHDLAFLHHGEHFTWKRWLLARLEIHHAVRSAHRLLAVSDATKNDLMSRFRLPPERIVVTQEGVSPRFQRPEECVLRALRSRHSLTEPYIVYVGRLQPRKNIVRLIEAFASVIQHHPEFPHLLVIAGDNGWMYGPMYEAAQASPVKDRIRFLGYVPDEDLPALIGGADALALVSLWEGFGLPVVEAMACGTAVITSNCSSLPEVAGDAALLVDPYDVADIARALERVIRDAPCRMELQQRGLTQAARFTWDATARTVMDAVRSIMPPGVPRLS